MNYRELSERVYDTLVTRGFGDEDYGDDYLMMVVMEVGRSVDACRRNKWVNKDVLNMHKQTDSDSVEFIYERVIKGTVEDGFADIMIRLLLWVGARKVNLKDIGAMCPYSFYNVSFTKAALRFIREYLCGSPIVGSVYYFQTTFCYMENWAEYLGIDLEWFVNAKMKYLENGTKGD